VTQPHEDGQLRPALTRLADTVSALCDPQAQTVDGRLYWLDSPYQQLSEAVYTERSQTGSGVSKSTPPLWVDAEDLLREIDIGVACAHPQTPPFDGDLTPQNPPTAITIRRLRAIEAKKWRPQDVHWLDQFTARLESWAVSIKNLLTETAHWSLPNPCPACQTRTVYHKDSGGETVRQPALQIGPMGCECQRCHAVWAPNLFAHLALVLGYPLPAGVLE
jgi:hypothetical protein